MNCLADHDPCQELHFAFVIPMEKSEIPEEETMAKGRL
jgi:hypothetical protein